MSARDDGKPQSLREGVGERPKTAAPALAAPPAVPTATVATPGALAAPALAANPLSAACIGEKPLTTPPVFAPVQNTALPPPKNQAGLGTPPATPRPDFPKEPPPAPPQDKSGGK